MNLAHCLRLGICSNEVKEKFRKNDIALLIEAEDEYGETHEDHILSRALILNANGEREWKIYTYGDFLKEEEDEKEKNLARTTAQICVKNEINTQSSQTCIPKPNKPLPKQTKNKVARARTKTQIEENRKKAIQKQDERAKEILCERAKVIAKSCSKSPPERDTKFAHQVKWARSHIQKRLSTKTVWADFKKI
jgi:hypothetical protein